MKFKEYLNGGLLIITGLCILVLAIIYIISFYGKTYVENQIINGFINFCIAAGLICISGLFIRLGGKSIVSRF